MTHLSKKTIWKLVLASLLIFTFPHPTPTASAQISTPEGIYTPGDCMEGLPTNFPANVEVECGTLTVPEDHSRPAGATIDLSVLILRSLSENRRPDPVFIAQGGPGGTTIGTFGLLLQINNPFADNRDVVLWDQRGTDLSTPDLRCEEFVGATIETLDQVLSDEEEARITLEAINNCRERYAAQNINLSDFNSRQNAADAEALRKALGYEAINFYGVSYGSLLGFYLLDAYPQGLRTAVLDAVVLPQENFLIQAAPNMYRSFNRLFDACQASPSCSENYPDLEDKFYNLIDQLNSQPAEITIANPQTQTLYPALLDGDLFLTAIFQLLYPTEYIAFLPKIITDAYAGDYDFLTTAILPLLLFDDTVSDGMYFSVICAEFMGYSPDDLQLEDLPPQIREPEARDLALLQEMCQIWGVEPLANGLETINGSNVPVLLLSGEFDPITPPQNAAQAADSLQVDQNVVFPAGGHGQLFSGECQNQIVLNFLDEPMQPGDTSCIPKEVSFVTDRDILPLPLVDILFSSDINAIFRGLFWLGLVLFALLALYTALLVYPIRWVIRRIQSDKKNDLTNPPETDTHPEHSPSLLIKSAPWLIFLAAIVLTLFVVLTASTATGLILDNNPIIFYGFPGSSWPLFILPFLFLALGMLIAFIAVLSWLQRSGSLLGRIYQSFLALSIFVGLLGLFQLGMFSVFFRG